MTVALPQINSLQAAPPASLGPAGKRQGAGRAEMSLAAPMLSLPHTVRLIARANGLLSLCTAGSIPGTCWQAAPGLARAFVTRIKPSSSFPTLLPAAVTGDCWNLDPLLRSQQ